MMLCLEDIHLSVIQLSLYGYTGRCIERTSLHVLVAVRVSQLDQADFLSRGGRPTRRRALYVLVAPETTKFHYIGDVSDVSRVAQTTGFMIRPCLTDPGNADIQTYLLQPWRQPAAVSLPYRPISKAPAANAGHLRGRHHRNGGTIGFPTLRSEKVLPVA